MDFEKIKENYPEIATKLKNWYVKRFKKEGDSDSNIGALMCDLENLIGVNRTLYDFFDEQGIYVCVAQNGVGQFIPQIRHEIDEDPYCPMWNDIKDSRTESEESAFEKAFEILNQKQ